MEKIIDKYLDKLTKTIYKNSTILRNKDNKVEFEGYFINGEIIATNYFENDWTTKFEKTCLGLVAFDGDKKYYKSIKIKRKHAFERYLRFVVKEDSSLIERDYVSGITNRMISVKYINENEVVIDYFYSIKDDNTFSLADKITYYKNLNLKRR